MSWHSIHVAQHSDLDLLITDAVRPFFRAVDATVGGSYFVRHWRRGPHLRLNLETGTEQLPGEVWAAAERIIGGFLAAHPSTRTLDSAAFADLHDRLARLENDPGPTRPWYPDNSLRIAPYEPGSGGVWTEFHIRTTDLTFRMTDCIRATSRRLTLGYDLMIATAHRLSGRTLVDGFPSFRSHAEGFLTAFPEGPGLRPQFDLRFARHAEDLVARARTVVAALDRGYGGVPFVGEWTRTLGAVQDRAREAIAAGRLALDDPAPGGPANGLPALAGMSRFHRELEELPDWPRVRTAPWFLAYRFALNCLYLQLTKLGITPVERYLLCHLAANSVEAGWGVSALEVLRGRP
jgi:hypothetical protein